MLQQYSICASYLNCMNRHLLVYLKLRQTSFGLVKLEISDYLQLLPVKFLINYKQLALHSNSAVNALEDFSRFFFFFGGGGHFLAKEN